LPKHAFLFLIIILAGLVILTNPMFLSPLLPHQPMATDTPTPTVTTTPTATATPDPFADVPTATPFGQRADTAHVLPTLPPVATVAIPTPASPTATLAAPPQAGQPPLPPTLTATTTVRQPTVNAAAVVLPDTSAAAEPATTKISVPVSNGIAPDRILIPRLNLDAPVEPVGMVPSSVAPGVFEWEVPAWRAAGWLNTTAPFGKPGNTVLDGHHNIKGEVFRDLWTLQTGDEIVLFAGADSLRYTVRQVLILPERGQPLSVRLRNAQYIQPTTDERLTLITCYPYESNTHRVVVVAMPQ